MNNDDIEEMGILKDIDSSSDDEQQSDSCSEDFDIHMADRSKQGKLEKADKRLYSPYKYSGIDYHFNPEVDK